MQWKLGAQAQKQSLCCRVGVFLATGWLVACPNLGYQSPAEATANLGRHVTVKAIRAVTWQAWLIPRDHCTKRRLLPT